MLNIRETGVNQDGPERVCELAIARLAGGCAMLWTDDTNDHYQISGSYLEPVLLFLIMLSGIVLARS